MISPKDMTYVGLDLSLTATGWARVGGGETASVGVLPPCKRKGAQRLAHLRSALLEVLPEGPMVCAVEGYAMGARGNTFDIGEWGGVAKLALYERGDCVVLIVPPSNLKMFVAEKGNAPKEDVQHIMAQTGALMGVMVNNDNEADALGLSLMAAAWHTKAWEEDNQKRAMEKVFPLFPVPTGFEPVRVRKRRRVGN